MDFAKILAKIDSIDSKQKLNESLKTEAKGAKPDFLDLDKDGNRKESMKKAAADAKSKKTKKVKEDVIDEESLDEVSAPGQEEWIKSNKDRFIKQYGKKKGNRILYATAWKRSKQQKESAQLEECYSQEMSQSDDRSGMSINSSLDTRTGTKTLTVSAEGAAADQLAQILKLSGMASPHGAHMDKEIELEEYANEPKPHTQGIEVQLQQGNDLNRPKKMTPHGYRNGDNPLAMDVSEQAEIDALVQSLSEELDAIKVDRSKIPAYKRKQQGGDWKTTQQDLERERERNISGPEGLAALKKKQGMSEQVEHLEENWSKGSSRSNTSDAIKATSYRKKAQDHLADAKRFEKDQPEHHDAMSKYHVAMAKSIKHAYHAGDYGSQGEAKSAFNKHMKLAKSQGVAEGSILKSIKRGLQGWGTGDAPTPQELVRKNKGYSDDAIKALARDTRNINPHTPGGLQKRVVDREMKKRGLGEQGVAEAMPMTSLTSRYVDDPKNPAFATKQPTGKDPLDSLPGIVALRKTDPKRAFRALQDYGFRNPNDPVIDAASKIGNKVSQDLLQKKGITDPRPWDTTDEMLALIQKSIFDYIEKNLSKEGVAEGSLNEISPDLLRRAATVAADKEDKLRKSRYQNHADYQLAVQKGENPDFDQAALRNKDLHAKRLRALDQDRKFKNAVDLKSGNLKNHNLTYAQQLAKELQKATLGRFKAGDYHKKASEIDQNSPWYNRPVWFSDTKEGVAEAFEDGIGDPIHDLYAKAGTLIVKKLGKLLNRGNNEQIMLKALEKVARSYEGKPITPETWRDVVSRALQQANIDGFEFMESQSIAEDIASTRREVNLKKKIDKGVATPEQKKEYEELKAKNRGPKPPKKDMMGGLSSDKNM